MGRIARCGSLPEVLDFFLRAPPGWVLVRIPLPLVTRQNPPTAVNRNGGDKWFKASLWVRSIQELLSDTRWGHSNLFFECACHV